MHAIAMYDEVFSWVMYGINLAIAISGVVGAGFAAVTPEDAYRAGDRMSKWAWVGIMIAAAVASYFIGGFLGIFATVAIGIYWFDVYPQLRDIQRGY